MKKLITLLLILVCPISYSQTTSVKPKFQHLPFGSVKPSGWIKAQMESDLQGFVGNLDKLVPELINDPIYSSSRIHKGSKAKELGNLKSGDVQGDDQYKWWNSETRSNWWDGFIRNVYLTNNAEGTRRVESYISGILASQDSDGYIGIYDKELRYNFSAENGELWSKTTILRGLLAYYEITKDAKAWPAILKSVENVMINYPVLKSSPFSSGEGFNGGVSHGLTFTDVLYKMYEITADRKYLDYAHFLYMNFSETHQSEKDAQLKNILNPEYKLQSHAVHSYEHLRPLIIAAYGSNDSMLLRALKIYLERINKSTTLTGGAIGDEWIAGRIADATNTGYEYCSLHELMDSYCLLLQQSGSLSAAEEAERIFYNAAQGSRDPHHSAIAYLKTDNSFEMAGTRNGETEAGRSQTRYKYSPAHQDVAVCCAPNAGRITPYFLQNMWMKQDENSIAAVLLGPSVLTTQIDKNPVKIEEITNYPYQNEFKFKIHLNSPLNITLRIRKPEWAIDVKTNEKYKLDGGFIVIQRKFHSLDSIQLEFGAAVRILTDSKNEKYFAYGALIYANPIEYTESKGRSYLHGFDDLYYRPLNLRFYKFIETNQAIYKDGNIVVNLQNKENSGIETLVLVPLSKTILRQAAF
jgi:uncharacterized protein